MIGAEILALVAILVGGGFGISAFISWGKTHKANVEKAEKLEELMRRAMHEALQQPGYESVDIFLAEWGHLLSKDERERLDDIRDNRYIIDEKK